MQILLGKHWHHIKPDQVVEFLDTDMEYGLDRFETEHRQKRFGKNALEARKKKSPLIRFLEQFNNPLMLLLVASSIVTALVKDVLDAVIIMGVVLVNAVVSFVQESSAEAAIEALISSLASQSLVIREGRQQLVNAAELVPGDVVLLNAGDKVPADMRIISSKGLKISEASLTGESLPSEKNHAVVLSKDTLLADRSNMAYASTLVSSGTGMGVVIATGSYTEIGRISNLISAADDLKTPLTRKMAQFSNWVLIAILVLVAGVVAINLLRSEPLVDTVFSAIALAVAMIPEGLPTALTVTLAIGVQRMAKKRAIIRRLPAVEALGSTTVICTDKTGTLTQNEMVVQEIFAGDDHFSLTGNGYFPQGDLLKDSVKMNPEINSAIYQTLLSGVLCNDASLQYAQDSLDFTGDPTEVALLSSAAKGKLDHSLQRSQFNKLDSIPFDSANMYMATLHRSPSGKIVAYIKGALDVLLKKSETILCRDGSCSDEIDVNKLLSISDDMAARGLRVLAFAMKELSPETTTLDVTMLESGLVFLGLQAMIDPPRQEVKEAVAACHRAGISVKMITGDHPLTALSIAKQVGILPEPADSNTQERSLTGSQLKKMTDAQLMAAVDTVNVFSRVSPDQKLRLVEALQSRGHVISMTGDGVNDGPALKQADIGIAMGITGTDVAKEASDMVLTDDNFTTIEAAVEEGRSIFYNIIKIIAWTLPTNIGEGLIILISMLIGEILPIIPIQILWVNMVTVGVLGIVLALEKKEPGIMQQPPRDPQASIISKWLLPRILFVGGMITLSGFLLFEWELSLGASIETARTAAVNALIFTEILYLFNSRSLRFSPFKIGFFSNAWLIAGVGFMILLQILFTYAPFMNAIFSSAPLQIGAWWRLLGFALITFIFVEIEKYFRLKNKNAAE